MYSYRWSKDITFDAMLVAWAYPIIFVRNIPLENFLGFAFSNGYFLVDLMVTRWSEWSPQLHEGLGNYPLFYSLSFWRIISSISDILLSDFHKFLVFHK